MDTQHRERQHQVDGDQDDLTRGTPGDPARFGVSLQVAGPLRPPSPRVGELMRRAAALALENERMVEAINDDAAALLPPAILADPGLAASTRAATRVNIVHWLGQVMVDPGLPVRPARSREGLALARDLIRRGYDTSALHTYLSGQNVAWHYWMQLCFRMTHEVDELQELLDHSARSIFTFVQDTITYLGSAMRDERDALRHGTTADRLELVSLILDGSPVELDIAGARLGHDLRPLQTTAIFWTDPSVPQGSDDLQQAALAAAQFAKLSPPLAVPATSVSLWAWFSSTDKPDVTAIADSVKPFRGVRVAIGATAPGLQGFRQSHADALTTQRLMFRAPAGLRSATFDEVRVVSLVTADGERAYEYVHRTLGALADADPVLRETLRVYLREDSNAARTARALYTHRNTILNRVAKAEALLPTPLPGRGLPVGLALEIVRWLGCVPTAP